jgi:hypothetical protein
MNKSIKIKKNKSQYNKEINNNDLKNELEQEINENIKNELENFDKSNNKKKINRKNKNTSSLSLKNINNLLDIHIEYINKLKEFKKNTNCSLRFPNFPECLSENIIKEYINIIEKRKCVNSRISGDLQIIEKNKEIKIEVKCFTSTGPTSFGPNEEWDEIYFLDAFNFEKRQFKIYKLNLSNKSEKFKKLKINSTKNYEDVCEEGKRPRIIFKSLKEQLNEDTKLVYSGDSNFDLE